MSDRQLAILKRQALARAIAKAGSQVALAAAIGKRQGQIGYWLNAAKRGVPGDYVLAIEKATGVSRHDLRPDLYPRERRAS
jgi:DNA-binding transcriptional regulator YdaS (Cro superfamily)